MWKGSRHAHQLPHSNAFLRWSWAWSHILRFMFLFIIFWISCINKLLNILLIVFELQVDGHNTPECLQTSSTHWSFKSSVLHMSTRLYLNYPTLVLKEHFLVLVLFFFLQIFSFYICTFPQDLRTWQLPLLTASQYPSQWANHVEGRAECLLWGVLHTCCGSELCFINRAPQK